MKLPPRRWRFAIAATVAALVLGGVLAWVGPGSSPKLAKGNVTITAADGIHLTARVFTPSSSASNPLVVIPASFGADASRYQQVGTRLAAAGYEAVAYTERGFGTSGGQIDFGGLATQRDVSSVITWALTHTASSATRIGVLGISYGAGMGLLAAEADPRIKAVVAMSTWTDMGLSLAQNDTVSTLALAELLSGRLRSGRLSPEVAALVSLLSRDPQAAAAQLELMAPARSPMTDIAALNRNHPAVMIANAYEDSFFAPLQLTKFFAALTTAKRLQLAPGDHGGPEFSGIAGQPNATFDDALSWLDHYLRGKDTGIDRAAPVQLKDVTTGGWHGYPSWPSASTTVDLAQPKTAGPAVQTVPAAWASSLVTGTDSPATSGPTRFISSADYSPPSANLINVAASGHALVWTGTTLAAAVLFSGSPSLHVSVSSSAGSVTFFAYLYDIAPTGVGHLMSVTPYTAAGLTPGVTRAVNLAMQPTSWTLPAGDHLALVVDTVDPHYHSAAPVGSRLTLSSTLADPATLSVPVVQ